MDVPNRYIVGIDLGTTNSAMAWVDTDRQPPVVETFIVPQLVAPAEVESLETLPSFHYQAAEGEFSPFALDLPWHADGRDYVVGALARDHGQLVPGRLTTSAKSWLCHTGVDRTAELLPWHAAADVPRLSPVEVSGRYLRHLREAWNHRHPESPLEQQDVVLTLPASFDEVARELTVKAAHQAGLPRVVLVEEPQAAFYAWIHAQGDAWQEQVQPGQKILVCDVGGGTSDFTLIRVRSTSDGQVQFHRVAVGEHLILGGDNLDLALAHYLESRLAGSDGKLPPRGWSVLVQMCRRVKETLLGPQAPEKLSLHLPGSGARLLGGARQCEVTRDDVHQVLVEGFLPRVDLEDKPQSRGSGFQEFGLPYAADAALTRYLASFLTVHRHAGDLPDEQPPQHDPARPDIVLFNGGFFASDVLRTRLLKVMQSWFQPPDGHAWEPLVLQNQRLDLAVAHGAAYYGLVRRGIGVRISAGLARTYYIGVEAEQAKTPMAVCLLPAGIEESETVDLVDRPFSLTIREPVEFPLFVSSTRLTDAPGSLVPVDREQLTALPPIRTVLQAGSKRAPAESLAVYLHARLTEIGTLDLWCGEQDGPRTWRLQFDVRAATHTDIEGHTGTGERAGVVDTQAVDACRQLLRAIYGPATSAAAPHPESVVKQLEQLVDSRRSAWPPSLLREMWDELIEWESGRRRSSQHEARWLYLVGYCLRPGYGMAVDDWRVAQSWRLLHGKLAHATTTCRVEWLVLWRRIAGGLSAGQQRALAEPLLANLTSLAGGSSRKGLGAGTHEAAEVLRLLGACELLGASVKVELGHTLLRRLKKEKSAGLAAAQVWALCRLGARQPMYGPLNTVVSADVSQEWTEGLMRLRVQPEGINFALMQLARATGDRYRDLPENHRREVARWMAANRASEHLQQLVREGGQLRDEEQGQMFGDSLPRGLRIV